MSTANSLDLIPKATSKEGCQGAIPNLPSTAAAATGNCLDTPILGNALGCNGGFGFVQCEGPGLVNGGLFQFEGFRMAREDMLGVQRADSRPTLIALHVIVHYLRDRIQIPDQGLA